MRGKWSKLLCACLAVLCLAGCGANGGSAANSSGEPNGSSTACSSGGKTNGNSAASSGGRTNVPPNKTSSVSTPGPEAEAPTWAQQYVEYYVDLLLSFRGEEKERDDSEIFDWTLFTLDEPIVLIEPLWAGGPPVVLTPLEFMPQFILFDTGIEMFPGSPSSLCTFYWDSTGKPLVQHNGGVGYYFATWYSVSAGGMGEMLFIERAEVDGTVAIGDLQDMLTEGDTMAWLDEHRPEVLAQHGYTAPLTPCKQTEYDLPETGTLPELEAYLMGIFTEYANTLEQ